VGEDAAGRLSRERTEVLTTKTAPVATVGAAVLTGAAPSASISGSGWAFTVGVGAGDVLLDDAGNLIVVWALVIGGFASAPSSDPLEDARFQFSLTWRHTIIQDVTRGLILLDTFTSGAAHFSPLGVGDLFNSFDFANFAGPSALVPQGGGVCEYAPALVDTTQQFDVSPILVTAAGGVHGWVGWARRHRTCSSISIGAGICSDCIPVTGADVSVRSGVLVQPPDADLEPLVLVPMSGTVGVTPPGLGFSPTLDRLVWRRTGVSAFFPGGGLNSGGSDSPGFVTRFADGATVQLTETLRASFGQRGVNVLLTDFAYVLDNPATAQPESAARNVFLDAWAFEGPTTLAGVTAESVLPEDAELAEVARLADLPEGLAHPTGLGAYALQVVNSSVVLGALGRFEDLS
jgi:hypothetical protein